MSNFQQSLLLEATPAAVYAALTTPAGLRGWWTQDCYVATEIGGTLRFRFGPNHKDMRIEQLAPEREVRWLCTGAHIARLSRKEEWVGTRLVFHITPAGEGRTQLDFEHVGLVSAFECYDLCSNGWHYFLDSLQQFVETGRGTPYEVAATPVCADHNTMRSQAA
jgi:uncharacterized protein YndB with AHSA1/START domain